MKAALIVLVCAAFLFSWRLSKTTAHIRVENLSEIDKTTKVEISIDRKVVFYGVVGEIASKFKTRLSRGNHYIVVRADNGEVVNSQQFKVKGKMRINVSYKAEYPIDPATNKPLLNSGLNKQMLLTVSDWDYPSKEVYAEIPDGSRSSR